jgi:hypothetical protein
MIIDWPIPSDEADGKDENDKGGANLVLVAIFLDCRHGLSG